MDGPSFLNNITVSPEFSIHSLFRESVIKGVYVQYQYIAKTYTARCYLIRPGVGQFLRIRPYHKEVKVLASPADLELAKEHPLNFKVENNSSYNTFCNFDHYRRTVIIAAD